MERFANRADAGIQLARRLVERTFERPIVLGLPRGGVPVAAAVALALGAPLDVLIVRKLGLPHQPEVAMGAIGEGGVRVLNDDVLRHGHVVDADLRRIEAVERVELDARVRRWRGDQPPFALEGRTAIIVDDGVATGATARAACRVARAAGAARVVLAVPVGPAETIDHMTEADEVVCLSTPANFMAVGMHYLDFRQTADSEVTELLGTARTRGR